MAFCIECGNGLSNSTKFCPSCGTPTSGATAKGNVQNGAVSPPLFQDMATSPVPPDATAAATFGQRAIGWLIDQLVGIAPLVVIGILAAVTTPDSTWTNPSPSPPPLVGFLTVPGFLWLFLHPALFEGQEAGQTLGKRAVGIRVLRERDGRPLGYLHALGRLAASIANWYGIGLLWPLWDPKRQTLKDKLAGTMEFA